MTPGSPPTVIGWVAAWEFECCGEPWRPREQVLAHPTSFEWAGDLPFDAPGGVEWYAGRHGAGDNDDSTTFILTRMWEMWRPTDHVGLHLVETWRTAPFSGSDKAQIADRPGYVADTDHHLGWLLELTEAGLPPADPSPSST